MTIKSTKTQQIQSIIEMTQFIKEYGILNEELQKHIISLVSEYILVQELEQSQLYSSTEEKKFIDLNKRKSRYKSIVDTKLFDSVEKLIKYLNRIDQYYDYKLIRNDVTYIKYEKGDFFKPHEDYLSFTSNMIEEYTFIMCVNSNNGEDSHETCEGGRTIFYVNDYFTHKSTSSITKNHCVIFRKDIKHEGELLTKGTKEILSFNLLALPKTSPTIIVIEFENELKRYCISKDKVDSCGENLFKTFLHFKNINDNNDKIIIYYEKQYTYNEFEIIYKILNKCYISISEYLEKKVIIDYYQISIKNLLITEFNTIPRKIENSISFTSDLILNETQEQTQFITQLVKDNQLPYVPFKLVLVEGTMAYGGEASDTEPEIYKMTPVWLSFGELNNVVFCKSLGNLKSNTQSLAEVMSNIDFLYPKSFKSFEESEKSYISVGKNNLNGEDEDEEDDETDDNEEDAENSIKMENPIYSDDTKIYNLEYDDREMYKITCVRFDLKYCMPNITNSKIIDITLDTKHETVSNTYYYPRENDVHRSNKWYSVNKENKMFLIGKQCEHVIDVLKNKDFENLVRSRINEIQFNFPQEKSIVHEDFCNESIYANCNLIFITGFLRVE